MFTRNFLIAFLLAATPALAQDGESKKQHVRHLRAENEQFSVQYELELSQHTLDEAKLKREQIRGIDIIEEKLTGARDLREALALVAPIGSSKSAEIKALLCSDLEIRSRKQNCHLTFHEAVVAGAEIFRGKRPGKGKKLDIHPACTIGKTRRAGTKDCSEALQQSNSNSSRGTDGKLSN